MAFRRTPEMTRQVKNIVDSFNHKRERMIKSGQYDIIPPRLKKSDVWKVIENSADPQKTYDKLVGTKSNPGTLRQALPSYSPQRYKPVKNAKGKRYAPASRDIDKAFNEISNAERQIQRDILVKKKTGYIIDTETGEIIYEFDTETGEIIDEDEYQNIIDDIIDQGGPLSEEQLPDYGEYDSQKYWKRVGEQFEVEGYIDRYLEAWDKWGLSTSYFTLKNMFDKMKAKNPQALLSVFLSGDEETTVEYIYEIWKQNIGTKSLRNGKPKNEGAYVVGMTRIVRYWQQKYDEIMGDE